MDEREESDAARDWLRGGLALSQTCMGSSLRVCSAGKSKRSRSTGERGLPFTLASERIARLAQAGALAAQTRSQTAPKCGHAGVQLIARVSPSAHPHR